MCLQFSCLKFGIYENLPKWPEFDVLMHLDIEIFGGVFFFK